MASASNIRAGNVLIEVLMNSTEALKEMDALQKRLNAFAANIGKVGLLFSGIGAGITAPLALATNSFAGAGDAIEKLGQRTGATVESLSALEYVADRSGVSFETVEKGAKALSDKLVAAAGGSKEAAAALKSVGLEAKDLKGMSLAEQFSAVAAGMSRMASTAEQSSAATKLFGKVGYQLVPMLKAGEVEMNNLMRRAQQLGVVLSEDDAAAAAALADAMGDAKSSLEGLNNSIGAALAPMATSFADATANAVAFASTIIRSNPGLAQFASIVGATMAALGSAALGLAGVTKATSLVIDGFKSANSAFRTLSTMMGAGSLKGAIAAFGLLGLKIAAVTAVLYGAYEALRLFLGQSERNEKMVRDFEAGMVNTPQMRELEDEAARRTKRGESSDSIQADFQQRYEAKRDEYQDFNRQAYAGGQQNSDEYKAREKEMREELGALETIVWRINRSGGINDRFFAVSKPTIDQQQAFNATLEKTKENLDKVNEARQKRNEERIFDNMVTHAPDAASIIIGEKAEAAAKRERDIHEQIAKIKKEAAEATREEMPALQEQLDLLSGQAEEAAKLVDYMDEWRRKAVAAADAVKQQASGMADQFAKLESANLSKAQEKAFRQLLDSGNWREAEESVVDEMANLEAAWAKNTAAVTDALAKAMQGNLIALQELEKLYGEQQDLSSRRDVLESRSGQVGGAREQAESSRWNVLREMDPQRFAAELETMTQSLRKTLGDEFARALDIESRGGDSSEAYTAANSALSRLKELESFSPSRDEMAGSLAGGTFSGEAAARMGGGGGTSQIARDQLETQRQMLRKLDSIDRKADDNGLGV